MSDQPASDIHPWHELTDTERAAYELGRISGLEDGFRMGWKAADESAEAAHRAVARIR